MQRELRPAMNIVTTNTGIITDIKKFATHDGPGIRTTVFVKGCPLHCRWCSNPETIASHMQLYFMEKRCIRCGECRDVCPENAIDPDNHKRIDRSRCTLCMRCVGECPAGALVPVGRAVAVNAVVEEIVKDMPFYGANGGLTLSGGEPLYQPFFSLNLLKQCHELGISTVLDTCGFASSGIVDEILDHVDLVLLDIKHMDPAMHRLGTGVDNTLILKNAMKMSRRVMVRISVPLISGYNDGADNLDRTAQFALSQGVNHIDLNPFHSLGANKYRYLGLVCPYGNYHELTRDEIARARDLLQDKGLIVTIGRMM